MSIQVEGADELATALFNLSKVRYEAVALISAKNIYNRGVSGGTPDNTGELRESMSMQKESNGASVGYSVHYAPHVEFGHRTRNGGYVEGQHFLERNVEAEKPVYKQLLKENLERVLKK